MPSASAYTNKLRFVASVKNTKAQLQGGVGNLTQSSIAGCGLDVNYSPIDYLKICPCDVDKPKVPPPPPPPYAPLMYTLFNLFASNPIDLAIDSSGIVYVLLLDTTIVKIDPYGNIISSITSGYYSHSIYVSGMNIYLACDNLIAKLNLNGDTISTISLPSNYPYAVTTDSSGNIYFADPTNSQIVKLDSAGIRLTTYSGLTNANGVAVDSVGNVYANYGANVVARVGGLTATQFFSNGINIGGTTIDPSGNLYVLDNTNNAIIKLNSSGALTNTFSPEISAMTYITIDSYGNVYIITDSGIFIRKFNSSLSSNLGSINYITETVTAISVDSMGYIYAVTGSSELFVYSAAMTGIILWRLPLTSPTSSIALDISRNVYVPIQSTTSISKVNPYIADTTFSSLSSGVPNAILKAGGGKNNFLQYIGGGSFVANLTSTGLAPTVTTDVKRIPSISSAFAITNYSINFFATSSSNTIRRITNTKSTDSKVTWDTNWTTYTITTASGKASPFLTGLQTLGTALYAVDRANSQILYFSNISTGVVSSTPTTRYNITGTGSSGTYQNIYVFSSSVVFVCDSANNRVVRLTLSGTSATYAGVSYSYDNTNPPSSITKDASNNLWVSFPLVNVVVKLNNTSLQRIGQIYVNTPTGLTYNDSRLYVGCADASGNGIIKKVIPFSAPSTITTTASSNFSKIAIDSASNIYVSTASSQIVQLDFSGTILETIPGVSSPNSIAIAPNRSAVYATTSSVVSKIANTITPIASLGGSMNQDSLICDSQNNLYASKGSGNRVVKITSSGTTTVIAGTGVAGYSGEGILATNSALNNPAGIALDSSGKNLYIAEYSANNSVRKVVLSL
jgi:sugar lactone lactonase YvrE